MTDMMQLCKIHASFAIEIHESGFLFLPTLRRLVVCMLGQLILIHD